MVNELCGFPSSKKILKFSATCSYPGFCLNVQATCVHLICSHLCLAMVARCMDKDCELGALPFHQMGKMKATPLACQAVNMSPAS